MKLLNSILAVFGVLIWTFVAWSVGATIVRESSHYAAEPLAVIPIAQTTVENASETNQNSPATQQPKVVEFERAFLVQEPPTTRQSFRPDFSSGFRSRNYRNNYFMLQAFKEAVGDCRRSTVQLVCDDTQCSLGTIVDSDGWVITKASELDAVQSVECILFDDRKFKAEIINSVPELDIALLHIPASGLTAVEWEYSIPDQGKWLATTDAHSGVPAAIGVVSTGPSKIPHQRAVMGIELSPDEFGNLTGSKFQGARVKHVLAGSSADRAGLLSDDIIIGVDGTSTKSREQLLALLRSGKGGQHLTLAVRRDDEELELRVRLMDLPAELLDETEMEVNGPISARATGFSRIFMHDTVLQPNQCGGPLFNLDGKAVGINIARAGRVASYALPADTVRPAVLGLIEQAKLVSHMKAPAEPNEPLPQPLTSSTPLATAP